MSKPVISNGEKHEATSDITKIPVEESQPAPSTNPQVEKPSHEEPNAFLIFNPLNYTVKPFV